MLVYGLSSHYHHDVVTFDVSGMFLTLLVCVIAVNSTSCYCAQSDTIERSEFRCLWVCKFNQAVSLILQIEPVVSICLYCLQPVLLFFGLCAVIWTLQLSHGIGGHNLRRQERPHLDNRSTAANCFHNLIVLLMYLVMFSDGGVTDRATLTSLWSMRLWLQACVHLPLRWKCCCLLILVSSYN